MSLLDGKAARLGVLIGAGKGQTAWRQIGGGAVGITPENRIRIAEVVVDTAVSLVTIGNAGNRGDVVIAVRSRRIRRWIIRQAASTDLAEPRGRNDIAGKACLRFVAGLYVAGIVNRGSASEIACPLSVRRNRKKK